MGIFDKPRKAVSSLIIGEEPNDQPYPLWVSVLGGVVLLVGVFLFTYGYLTTGRDLRDTARTEIPTATATREPEPSGPSVETVPITTSGQGTGALGSDPATASPSTEPVLSTTETLALSDGTTLPVPKSAVAAAEAAAVAAFTGLFADVPMVPGFTTPTLGTSFPDAQVSEEVTVVSARLGSWVLQVPVAADSGSASVPVVVELVADGSDWLVSSLR